jgi:eukaryotic-like serine/threonine-protein kinase
LKACYTPATKWRCMREATRDSRSSQTLQFADYHVDLRARELRRNGTKVRLQKQPFQVLALLVEHAGEVVTREELRQHLWSSDTFVDFDSSLNTAINKIREALGDSVENPRFVETLPHRGYRFIRPLEEFRSDAQEVPSLQSTRADVGRRYLLPRIVILAVLAAIAISGTIYWVNQHFGHRLTEKDTIILADFANSTGDPIFDGTLKQALEVQLQQSPFLSLVSNQDVHETLQFMGRSADEAVLGGVAQEVCQRQSAKAVVQGAIKSMGSHYVLGLNALNCHTGASLAEEQVEVGAKEQVLTALGTMASRLRGKLGESLALMEKYDTPVLQATTSSLEALKAYSLGVPEQEVFNDTGAFPFFKRAIELDPNFALAFAKLTIAYSDAGEDELARQYVRKAFALRERVSEREKLSITALYHDIETRNLEKKMEADRLWAKTYPREWFPHVSLAFDYAVIGSFGKALEESLAAVRVAPHSLYGQFSVAAAYLGLNRWQESRAGLEALIAQGREDFGVYCLLYQGALIQGDEAAMQNYLQAAMQKLEEGHTKDLRFMQAEVGAFHGQLRMARELSERAVQAAEAINFEQNVGTMLAQKALWEAQVRNLRRARDQANRALAKARGIDVDVKAALALTLSGDSRKAEMIADNLAQQHPEDTLLNAVSIPLIRSALALKGGNAMQAIELLKTSEEYELGIGYLYYPPLMPSYMRGQAYLKLCDSSKAAAEFQKILDHRGVGPASLNYALARLGLGRAKALEGDVAGARIAYQDFFTLWKDADPDIPVLRDAKAEYAKLQ